MILRVVTRIVVCMNETIGGWVPYASRQLTAVGLETARLDALVILCDEIGRDKAWVLAHPEMQLTAVQKAALDKKVVERAKHIPLAYLRGHAEFYGRTFALNRHVLVPRPESEALIDLLLSLANPKNSHFLLDRSKNGNGGDGEVMTIVDVGTGSGCLAITAKLELPHVRVVATDIDQRCLAVAQKNARRLGAEITLTHGSLLTPLPLPLQTINYKLQTTTVLLANLPYVPTDYPVNPAATHEPATALYGGTDGLDYYRQLFAQARALAAPPAAIITEALITQHSQLATVATPYHYRLHTTHGLAQLYVYGSVVGGGGAEFDP